MKNISPVIFLAVFCMFVHYCIQLVSLCKCDSGICIGLPTYMPLASECSQPLSVTYIVCVCV